MDDLYIFMRDGIIKHANFQEILKAAVDENGILQENILFRSPSYAAAFVLGRNANGWTAWKTEDGKTLREVKQVGRSSNDLSNGDFMFSVERPVLTVCYNPPLDWQDNRIDVTTGKPYGSNSKNGGTYQ